jgi:G2/mitotic-specific cyclin 2
VLTNLPSKQTLNFNVSTYCTPYSWVRRISKADDYDVQTRTLSKFLMEVTLLDHRFLRARPSMVAAMSMFLAKQMLNGQWVSSPAICSSRDSIH